MQTCASMTKALVVRLLLILHVFLTTWRVTVNLENLMYWLLLCIIIPLVIECFYTMIRRKGSDYSRFTLCFLFYLAAVLPGIWLLELDRSDLYIQGKAQKNARTEDPTAVGISQSIWLIVVEEAMPYMIFICRWIIPRGSIDREELSDLLFAYIEIGADIMEFFSLLDEDVVRADKTLGYTVLTIWTVSILQFTMTITVIYKPKKKKGVVEEVVDEKEEEWKKIKHDIFVIFMVLLMQDLPFLVMRMFIIIYFNRITYSLIFFIAKNLLVFVLLLHRVAILCRKRHCPDLDESEDKAVAIRGTGDINETERGRVRRKNSLAGSLATDFLGSSQAQSNFAFNHSPLDGDLNLKKRSAKPEQQINTLIDNGIRPQRVNGNIRSNSSRPQASQQRSADGYPYSSSASVASTSILKDDTNFTSTSAVSRIDRIRKPDSGFYDYMEPVDTRRPSSNSDNYAQDNMPSKIPKGTDAAQLRAMNPERSRNISTMPTLNTRSVQGRPTPENLQQSHPQSTPSPDTSNKTTQTIQESSTQTDNPGPLRDDSTKAPRLEEDNATAPKMHSSVSTQVSHRSDVRPENKDPGPHITKIIF